MDVIEKINEYVKKLGPDWYIKNSYYYKNIFYIRCHTSVCSEVMVGINTKFQVGIDGKLKLVYHDCMANTETDNPTFTRIVDDINMIFKVV